MLLVPCGELLLRVNGNAAPSKGGLKVIGVALFAIVVGADVHKGAVAPVVEEIPDDPFLAISRFAMRAVRPLEVTQFGGSVCSERSRSQETRRVMDSHDHDGAQQHAADQE